MPSAWELKVSSHDSTALQQSPESGRRTHNEFRVDGNSLDAHSAADFDERPKARLGHGDDLTLETRRSLFDCRLDDPEVFSGYGKALGLEHTSSSGEVEGNLAASSLGGEGTGFEGLESDERSGWSNWSWRRGGEKYGGGGEGSVAALLKSRGRSAISPVARLGALASKQLLSSPAILQQQV